MKYFGKKNTFSIYSFFYLFVISTLITSCGGGGASSGNSDGGAADTTAPTVSVNNLSDLNTNTPLDIVITLTFSEAIAQNTVDTNSIRLEDNANSPVVGTLNIDESFTMVSFTPDSSLLPSTQYTLTATQALTDIAGNSLGASLNLVFTTLDNVAPKVLSTTPQNEMTNVGLNASVTAVFDEAIDASTLNATSFQLSDSSGSMIESSINLGTNFTEATLIPNTELALLSRYNVTLTTDISDESGNDLSNAEEWQFITRDGAWSDAEVVEINNVGEANSSQVAINNRGEIIAVWAQADGFRANIWVNRFSPETGWGTAELLETNEADASFPQIAINDAGDAVAVWLQSDGTDRAVWSSHFSRESGWTTPETIEQNPFGGAAFCQVAMDEGGNAIAIWRQGDGSSLSVWHNRYTPDVGWGDASLVETNFTDNDVTTARIAMNREGFAVAVWGEIADGRENIWSNRFVPESGWQTAELLENSIEDSYDPKVSIADNGSAFVIWEEFADGAMRIASNRFSQETGWLGREIININPVDGFSFQFPSVSTSNSGEAIAIWRQEGTISVQVMNSRFSPTRGWQPAEVLHTGNSSTDPIVEIDNNGHAIALWVDLGGGGVNDLYSRRYTPEGDWSERQLLETQDLGHVYSPKVAINEGGKAVAIWEQSDGLRTNITSSRFE